MPPRLMKLLNWRTESWPHACPVTETQRTISEYMRDEHIGKWGVLVAESPRMMLQQSPSIST
jgi:hypothetical protein